MTLTLTFGIFLGVGDPRSCTGYPEGTPEVIIQDLCWPRFAYPGHCRSSYPMALQESRHAVVDLGMCGTERVNI